MFIRLNNVTGSVAYVLAAEITGIIQGAVSSSVFIGADPSPYEVVELAEDIVERVSYIRNKAEVSK